MARDIRHGWPVVAVTELFEFETIEQINEAELAWAALQRQRSGIMTAPSADARAA